MEPETESSGSLSELFGGGYAAQDEELPETDDDISLNDLLESGDLDLEEEPDSYDSEADEAEDAADLGSADAADNTAPDFKPKFDIMSLLNEQISSYSEMTLSERMDEIEVDTMEVSLDELAAYIKENRKKRGA